jgi:DNA-directed RNA polymerase II subunit RPB2
MCPFESPDGASIGLLKNFAIMCHVTFDTHPSNIMRFLADNDILLIENASFDDISKETKIFVNNNLVGISKNPVDLCRRARLLKRNSMLNVFTGVAWDILQKRINIQTEAGRCCRPLYVVEKGKLLIDRYVEGLRSGKIGWSELTRGFSRPNAEENDDVYINSKDNLESTQAPIEFVDVEESNNLYIAMSPSDITQRHTHCEIHPSTILSILTHQIPLVHHNQAPRVVFSGAQGKQAIGMYATNFANRIDTMAYVMHYPQRSLVTTRYKDYLNNNNMPNGENLIVAIATYTGYNMEDGIIFNKAAIDRGCFNITYYKNLVENEEQSKFSGESVVFGNPLKLSKTKELQQVKFANYTKLDENGFPLPNKYINEGDAYIGKAQVKAEFVEEPGENIFGAKVKKEFYYDKSSVANKTLSGVVDKVFVFTGDSGMRTCKIRLRKFRTPEPGDKVCSTIAQKGVIGAIIPYEDMPFTKDGIVPDIIINPHAIPSRMTIGQLLESVLGKTACMEGTRIDGTAFENYDYEEIFDTLQSKYKFDRTGNEIMYSGFYGCQLGCEVFIGPTYYQRLKHMVSDKMNYRKVDFMTLRNEKKVQHVRSAPYEFMTRQPTHGRGSEGGLRLGNMEFDSITSHGMSQFLHESSLERSDAFEWELDNETNMVSNNNSSIDVSRVKTPYSFKLLTQEIAAMGIKAGMLTNIEEESEEDTYDDFSHEVRDAK